MDWGDNTNTAREDFAACRIVMLCVSSIDAICVCMIILSSIMCLSNFGKGLKEILIKQNLVADSTQLSEII